MGSLAINHCSTVTYRASNRHPLCPDSASMRAKFIGLHNAGKSHNVLKFRMRTFASKKSVKKLKRDRQLRLAEKGNGVADRSGTEDDYVKDESKESTDDNFTSQTLVTIPSRSNVLQACTVTCGLITALGVIIRQGSHVASLEGLPFLDGSTEVTFDFELWHLELITGLVVLVSSCRYLLLKTWPDFAKSSEAANQQVLTSLEPLDYLVVAFLPGISEELLFRGALLPLFGMDWKSVLAVATVFGALHLGSGRKYSFAVCHHLRLPLSGQRLLASHMATRQVYPRALSCQWLLML
ncbi:uncharacterized protein LOC102607856 isoform X2 [Citrus sinensis]|uniref:uncharacterized protein LOC102607856 isoform X2 n=1 Tax=Citrus sinensis TaxID=2711 RepID=UPI0007637E7B|nr:uncharacterized protein LOC102607856 isoform X2 [Citrus sinensis]